MLTISLKLQYGLLALIELTHYLEKGPIQLKTISNAHNIPSNYLEQVMSALKQVDLIQSFRGSSGGYALLKSPHDIPMKDVFVALSGISSIDNRLSNNGLSFFWDHLMQNINNALSLSLYDFFQLYQKNNASFTYNI